MLLLILPAFYWRLGAAFASPLGHNPCPSRREGGWTDAPPYDTGPDPLSNTRSLWDITWGCFSTIFACTWLAVHPNVPKSGEGDCRQLWKRLLMMVRIILLPETMIYWAWRQYWAAGRISQAHNQSRLINYARWTRAHGFFSLMGGFVLYKEGKPVRVLTYPDLTQLFDEGKIDWPSITIEELQDKSKADYFSKGVALLQTTWFLVTCVVRAYQKLALSELEIATLAFATLNGAIYFLWWNKPMDLRCPFAVHMREITLEVERPSVDDTQLGIKLGYEKIEQIISTQPQPMIVIVRWLVSTRRQLHTITSALKRISPLPSASTPKKLLKFLGKMVLFQPARSIASPLKLDAPRTFPDGTTHVPAYYAPATNFKHSYDLVILSIVNLIIITFFAAVHLLAWSFRFPTAAEKVVWRSSSLVLFGTPYAYFLSVGITTYIDAVDKTERANQIHLSVLDCVRKTIFVLSLLSYFVARVILLVLPLLDLRSLPEDAYVDVDWSSFIPHL